MQFIPSGKHSSSGKHHTSYSFIKYYQVNQRNKDKILLTQEILTKL
jgi:hypothetical protein